MPVDGQSKALVVRFHWWNRLTLEAKQCLRVDRMSMLECWRHHTYKYIYIYILCTYPTFRFDVLSWIWATDYVFNSDVNVLLSCWFWIWCGVSCHHCELVNKVEINEYACKVLQKRMSEGLLHHAKIHRDVKTFKVPADTPARGAGGGFPCQAPWQLEWLMSLMCSCRSDPWIVFCRPGNILRWFARRT